MLVYRIGDRLRIQSRAIEVFLNKYLILVLRVWSVCAGQLRDAQSPGLIFQKP